MYEKTFADWVFANPFAAVLLVFVGAYSVKEVLIHTAIFYVTMLRRDIHIEGRGRKGQEIKFDLKWNDSEPAANE